MTAPIHIQRHKVRAGRLSSVQGCCLAYTAFCMGQMAATLIVIIVRAL